MTCTQKCALLSWHPCVELIWVFSFLNLHLRAWLSLQHHSRQPLKLAHHVPEGQLRVSAESFLVLPGFIDGTAEAICSWSSRAVRTALAHSASRVRVLPIQARCQHVKSNDETINAVRHNQDRPALAAAALCVLPWHALPAGRESRPPRPKGRSSHLHVNN